MTEKKSSEKIVVYIGKDLFLSGPIRQAALSEGWTFRQEDPGKAETLSPEGTIVAVFDLSALKDEVFPLSETLRRRKEKRYWSVFPSTLIRTVFAEASRQVSTRSSTGPEWDPI